MTRLDETFYPVCHFSEAPQHPRIKTSYALQLKSPKMQAASILEISAQSAVICTYAKMLWRFG